MPPCIDPRIAGKYLATYAEPEVQALKGLPEGLHYRQLLVIPACNEPPDFLARVPTGQQATLLILVINQDTRASASVSSCNQHLAVSARAFGQLIWSAGGPVAMHLYHSNSRALDLLVVDRFSPGVELAKAGGVGHARKIGADLALALINSARVDSPWIHNTDADTELPESYFESGQQRLDHAAAVLYPFRHRCNLDQAIGRATALYEFSLDYYVAGMRWAGSPYGFQTVGSSFAIHAERYAQVRGFPKRPAAEDFYMLNKLAKVAPIIQLDCAPIMIEARTSDRVPFGTGAAVGLMLNMHDPEAEFMLYDPRVFAGLKSCQQALKPLWEQQTTAPQMLAKIIDSQGGSPLPAEQLVDALYTIGLSKALEHAFAQSSDRDQFERQFHSWFDAFRSLKLVHLLRDRWFASMPRPMLLTQPLYALIASHEPGLISTQ